MHTGFVYLVDHPDIPPAKNDQGMHSKIEVACLLDSTHSVSDSIDRPWKRGIGTGFYIGSMQPGDNLDHFLTAKKW